MDLYPSASPSNLVDLESKWQPFQKQKQKQKTKKKKKARKIDHKHEGIFNKLLILYP